MKNNLNIQKNKYTITICIIFFFFGFNLSNAQVQNNGTLYISDGGVFYVKSGNFTFGSGSSTQTSRTASTYGKLVFGETVTHSGETAGSTLFVNGFASTRSTSYYLLPTGQGTTYAPILVANTTVTNGVSAAFNSGALTNASNIASSIAALPASGYWQVYGDNSKLTLMWSSDISTLSYTIANLTVAGYNISSNKWEAISSATPTGTEASGSIETSSDVVLANYSAFTLAKRGITCAPVFAATGTTKTWNGTWSPSAPTEIDDAIIASAGAPGSFVCNTLAVNADISITDNQTIEVVNAITGSGVITMSSQASILQRNNDSGIAPTISLTKNARNGMYAYDYIYWGSPLKSTVNTLSLLGTAQAYTNNNAATSGAVGALDNYYKYVSGITTSAGGWQTLASNPQTGTGFITRIKNQAPFATFQVQNTTDHINLTFAGATNNGTINVPIANNLTSPNSARNFNLLGNPYPSAIDAEKFLEYNTDLDGAVYIWKATTPNTGAAGASYTSGDYIAYTRVGFTAEPGIDGTSFNGKIASGQGFKVKAISTTGSGTATFNNCMRVSGNNDQFMRTNNNSNNAIIDRYKLNFRGANGVGNQILVAYTPEATLAYDRMYDAELNSVSPAQMYSVLDNASTQLGINARPAFQISDAVALGIDKSNAQTENFTISISNKEGIFQNNEINVFLHDKTLNVYRNLADAPYEFTSSTTQLLNRFEIVYQRAALNNTDFESNNVQASIKNQVIKINASLPITDVTIYDISGRLITNFKVNYLLEANNPFYFASGVYVAKIKLSNGAVTAVKLINKN